MSAFTYYSESELEIKKSVLDKDVNEWYQEVRKVWPRLYLTERAYPRKRGFFTSWFKEQEFYFLYDVRIDIDGKGQMREVQCINMGEGFFPSINKHTIICYLIGVIHGHDIHSKNYQP